MFYKTNVNGVVYYKSDFISLPHGFATREGGVSDCEQTKNMNFAFGRGDRDETVIKNFEIFTSAIGADPKRGVMLGQVHSANVLTVTESEFGLGVYKKTDLTLDGYVSNTPGALLTVRVADCVPVLFADEAAGVIGAVHAGWRGSARKIVSECVDRMVSLGAKKANIKAAIGPSICAECFVVGDDFMTECEERLGKTLLDKFTYSKDGRWHADLKLLNKLILLENSVIEANIDVTTLCTYCNPDEFFSHRYHGQSRGTLCAMISL